MSCFTSIAYIKIQKICYGWVNFHTLELFSPLLKSIKCQKSLYKKKDFNLLKSLYFRIQAVRKSPS